MMFFFKCVTLLVVLYSTTIDAGCTGEPTTPSYKPSHTPSYKPSHTPSYKPSHTPSYKPSHTPSSKPCPCYTATTWRQSPACPTFNPPKPCEVPDCIVPIIVPVPAHNPRCPRTRTRTSLLPCQTACVIGCATETFSTTLSSTCLPTTPTITIPSSSRPCYTSTVTASGTCPEDTMSCTPPDCIYLSTTTVPAGAVAGCSVTPTSTATRSCKGSCDAACGTQWVTETAVVWKV